MTYSSVPDVSIHDTCTAVCTFQCPSSGMRWTAGGGPGEWIGGNVRISAWRTRVARGTLCLRGHAAAVPRGDADRDTCRGHRRLPLRRLPPAQLQTGAPRVKVREFLQLEFAPRAPPERIYSLFDTPRRLQPGHCTIASARTGSYILYAVFFSVFCRPRAALSGSDEWKFVSTFCGRSIEIHYKNGNAECTPRRQIFLRRQTPMTVRSTARPALIDAQSSAGVFTF